MATNVFVQPLVADTKDTVKSTLVGAKALFDSTVSGVATDIPKFNADEVATLIAYLEGHIGGFPLMLLEEGLTIGKGSIDAAVSKASSAEVAQVLAAQHVVDAHLAAVTPA